MDNRAKFRALTGAAIFFGLIAFVAIEIRYLGYYLEPNRLLWFSVPFGALLTALVCWRILPRLKGQSAMQFRAATAIFLACMGLSPWLVSAGNRLFVGAPEVGTAVEFIDEQGRYSSRFGAPNEQVKADQFQLFFYYEQELHRIRKQEAHFSNARRGDTIQLPIRTGNLGLQWVQFAKD